MRLGLSPLVLGLALASSARADSSPARAGSSATPGLPSSAPVALASAEPVVASHGLANEDLPLRWQAVVDRVAGTGVRGITVGPIENALHAERGYGGATCAAAMVDARRLGANWVSVTPFGRIWDLSPSGVDLTFETPFRDNRAAVARAIRQAHGQGLKVLLVPHLWTETGGWRGEIDPGSEHWQDWVEAYSRFVLTWAKLASVEGVDLFSIGVELRSWLTGERAEGFRDLVRQVREVFAGPVTHAANWDDVHHTIILDELDVIGVNGFYPLTEQAGASAGQLLDGARKTASELARLARVWRKPILFTEMGYTTRRDPALRPWEWPEDLHDVVVSEAAQAEAYTALLSPLLEEPWFMGFFVWRFFSDPNDASQEPWFGFSPRGKQAELVMRDAFLAHWAVDGSRPVGAGLWRRGAQRIGLY